MRTEAPARRVDGDWRRLLRYAAIADVAVMAVVGVALRDKEALAFAGIVLLFLTVLRFHGGVAGAVLLGVALIDSLAWMAPAALSNLTNREDLLDILVPASIAIISLTGALAAFGSVFRRGVSVERVAGLVPQAAIAVFVVALAAGIVQARRDVTVTVLPGDLAVDMRNTAFAQERLDAEAGEISIVARNHDLFFHTFTIERLGVNVGAPTGSIRRATFRAEPGTYTYYCAVIGHRLVMKGTLVVR
jgi:plastocyanin